MTRLQMVATHCAILPTEVLWAELMGDTDSNAAAVQVLGELERRKAL